MATVDCGDWLFVMMVTVDCGDWLFVRWPLLIVVIGCLVGGHCLL